MLSRLVLVHGFSQTRECWGPTAANLAAEHDVVAVDAPGHGASSAVRADPAQTAAILAGHGPAAYLGYSMGGRMCLETALRFPEAVERLVLISATAGIENTSERLERRQSDERLAERIERDGVDTFIDHWLAQPLFAGLAAEARYEAQRRSNSREGLASSLRLAGAGSQEPSWDHLGELAMPVLVVAGEDDPKFVGLGRRLAAAVGPNATLAVVPDAGHTVHLEQPEAFLAAVRGFLSR